MSDIRAAKILIVDDELELKNALVEALAAQSFDVLGFTDPTEALATLEHEVFDVILTDLMMPQMDGITVVERALEIDPHLVAIIMTGQGTIQTAVDAMKIGAFDYVLKPFRLAKLLPILTRAINTRRLRVENLQLRETVAIYELCQTIAFTLDEQTLISKLADAALQQTNADEVSVLLPAKNGEELYVAAVRGQSRQRMIGQRVPLEETITGWVVREQQPLLLTGEIDDPRFHALCPNPQIMSSISVPMLAGNKLVGTVNINAIETARPFTLGQMKALTILASTAAAALETASLYSQIEKERRRLDNIVGNIPGAVWESTGKPNTDSQRTNFVSDYVVTMLGYAADEWMSRPNFWLDVVHPEDRARVAETASAEFDQGQLKSSQEFRCIKKDGTPIWVEATSTVITDENNRPIGTRGVSIDITERKRTEEALRRSDAEMKALFESMSDIILVLDSEGRYLKVAPTKPKQPYRPAIARIGKTLHEVCPDKADLLLATIHAALAQNATQRIEYSLTDGEQTFWYDGSVSPMTESTVVWVARDITERKLAAAKLQESEERYRDLVEKAHDIIYSHDLDGNYTSVNRAVEQITGYTPEESLSLNVRDLVTPEYADQVNDMISRKLKGESTTAYEMEIVSKDGRCVPLEVNSKLVCHNGVPVGVQGIARDITERRRAETELRFQKSLLESQTEASIDGVFVVSPDGEVLSFNRRFLEIWRIEAAEFKDRSARDILKLALDRVVSPASFVALVKYLNQHPDEQSDDEVELCDGRILEQHSAPVRGPGGEYYGRVWFLRDITERRRAQSERNTLEEQLRQSQKMEAIGRLAGGVAHDFNNLLTAINGYTTMAMQRVDDQSPIRPYLEEVKKAGERAANLTRQLLAFGRKQILQPISLDLNSIVSDMNKMLRRLIGEDVELTAKLAPDLEKIKADPGQIEQVLVNLMVNARDAMPHGGTLTIETANVHLDEEYTKAHVEATPGNYVMLSVSDSGLGMDEATRSRIFEPFFTTKEKGKGTGLGLSTVYGIVQQSGGTISVDSWLNQGTTFKLYLPRIETCATPATKASAEEVIARGTETILLVEDEDVVRGLAAHILKDAGYQVISAGSGDEAIGLCRQHSERIDMVLTDVVMPEVSGKEVAERAKVILPHVKVLFMSGYTDEAIVHHGVLDSNVEFIQKPFTPLALSKKVRQVLDANGHNR